MPEEYLPEDELPDDDGLSKRERQKLRRQQRLEAERAQARRSRFVRLTTIGVIVALALGLVGFFVQRTLARRAEEQRLRAEAAAQLDELGCTDIEPQPNLGAGHLEGSAASLAASPPDLLYPDRPTTSGQHMPTVTATGVYDVTIDERITTHNLEHGYVVFWYDEDADPDEVAQLKDFGRAQIDGRYDRIIVAPYYEPLPGDYNVAIAAWNYRQLCEEFEPGVGLEFLARYHGINGEAPEKFVEPHTAGGQGVLTPEGGEPLLLPPLDSDQPAPEGTAAPTEGATEEEAGAEDPAATPTPTSP